MGNAWRMKEEDRAILEVLYDLWVQGEHRAVVDRIAAVEAEDPRQATYLAIKLSNSFLSSDDRERFSDMLADHVYPGRTMLPEQHQPNPIGEAGCEGCQHCLPVANLCPEACARCDRWCKACSKARHPRDMVPFALPGRGRIRICSGCYEFIERELEAERDRGD